MFNRKTNQRRDFGLGAGLGAGLVGPGVGLGFGPTGTDPVPDLGQTDNPDFSASFLPALVSMQHVLPLEYKSHDDVLVGLKTNILRGCAEYVCVKVTSNYQ
jgi:hypothetical protein